MAACDGHDEDDDAAWASTRYSCEDDDMNTSPTARGLLLRGTVDVFGNPRAMVFECSHFFFVRGGSLFWYS